jgi:hypothetical protein
MWQTEDGDRVLGPAEWEFFRQALGSLWDWVEAELEGNDPFHLAIDPFDALQPEQKLVALAAVGRAMRDESVPPPQRTAVTDGAVAAVLAFATVMIDEEIDCPLRGYTTFWRSRASAAWKEASGERRSPVGPRSKDYEAWDDLIVSDLGGALLGDMDYGLSGVFLDADPAVAHAYMRLMNIRDDFFLAVAPEPTAAEVEEARATLRELTGYPGPQPEFTEKR